mgnify:CR=1 FL=1
MNEHDAILYAEDKGIEDGCAGNYDPPFRSSYCPDIAEIYQTYYFYALAMSTFCEEFPNG